MSRASVLLILIGAAMVLLGEGILRMEPGLPSLRAEVVPFRPHGRPAVVASMPDIPSCRGPENDDKPLAWTRSFGNGEQSPIRLLVAGDSITLGDGVEPEESYAGRIGASIAATEGRPVEVVNVAVNATGYCHVIRAVHRHLRDASFDTILVGLFADDLEQRAVNLEGGQIRVDPEVVGGVIGGLASSSYLFNWVWLQLVEAAVNLQTSDGEHPAPHVTRPGRTIPPQSLQNFSASLEGLMPHQPLFVLIPPVGGPLCPKQPESGSECEWLFADMDEMASRLAVAGDRFIDLRELWSDRVDHTQDIEQRWWREHGRLPVHPNAEGHARIAEALLSSGQIP